MRMAEYVQAALSRHNIRLRIVTRPWREFESALNAGEADLFYLSWFADSGDPVAFLAALFGSENQGPAGNRTRYANAQVDSLLQAARECPEDTGCLGPLLEAERIALSDAPLIPLFQSVNVTLVRPWVRGLALDPFGCPRYDTVEIVRPAPRTAEGD
jgi:peptide/nickel transport system substrate-binding protein